MTDRTFVHRWGTLLLAPLLLTFFLAGVSFGEEYWLRAEVKTIPAGTFGNMSSVAMWGYARCGAGFSNCTTATVPGPILTAHVGTALTVHVFNNISGLYREPTSLVVNGQRATETGANTPVWTDGTSGPRGTNYDLRVRSFTHEAALGGSADYVWGAPRQGTYLYESGTHPAIQVQMGLYGPLVVYPAGGAVGGPGTAYGSAYQAEALLLFSEIDPVLHAAISNGDYGPGKAVTSPIDYHPKFFLVNGLPYTTATSAIGAGSPGQTVLLRLLNAGLQPKMPTIQDQHHLLTNEHARYIAEDGNQLPGAGQRMYSRLLAPGKTLDALLTTQDNGFGGGDIAVYDRMLNLSNGQYAPGGALQFLNVGPVPTLTALPNVLDFGTVALFRPVQMVVSVKNDGLMPLIFSNTPGISGPDAAEFRTVFEMAPVQPGESVALTVLFRPTSAGSKSATLTLVTNDPNGQTLVIPILGTAY
jgi:FtsP/CotA-like multicopper oxidase with cupredoxin domain